MKTVTIPSDYHPYVVEVNGKVYKYPEGTTQSVPDEVAAVIENYWALYPRAKATGSGLLPDVSVAEDGKILQVVNGAWQPNDLPVWDGGVE